MTVVGSQGMQLRRFWMPSFSNAESCEVPGHN